jgi:hypothetical protein
VRSRIRGMATLAEGVSEEKRGKETAREALKWGQPSYLTPQSQSGSTIRIDQVKPEAGQRAVYFHCQTNLVE